MRKPNGHCADCGKAMWRGTTSLPDGKARCQGCRRLRPTVKPDSERKQSTSVCLFCGQTFTHLAKQKHRQYCGMACVAKYHSTRTHSSHRHPNASKVTRALRERAAPGLPRSKRTQLLRLWQKQGRTCFYCSRYPDTVDHVVPLVRQGTNWEGNLVPCCRSCNSSKAHRTVAEWRIKRQKVA